MMRTGWELSFAAAVVEATENNDVLFRFTVCISLPLERENAAAPSILFVSQRFFQRYESLAATG
jgi:hypothetical protein